MESGCKILWTDHALRELADNYEYLKIHFTERELNRVSVELDKILKLISQNPKLFPLSDKKTCKKSRFKKVQHNLL